MSRRSRILGLLFVLFTVSAAKLGGQIYRWYAFADERAQILHMRGTLEEVGLEVIRTQMAADSLRQEIRAMDDALREARNGASDLNRRLGAGILPAGGMPAYERQMRRYHGVVDERNAHFEAWRNVVLRNHRAVDTYNDLADTMRDLAERMGEPYFYVPAPAEIAVKHGVTPRGGPIPTGVRETERAALRSGT